MRLLKILLLKSVKSEKLKNLFLNIIGKEPAKDHTQDPFNMAALCPVAQKRSESGELYFISNS